MIQYKTGNILDSDTQALVNTVNTVGVMGKGIALQFKKAFPANFKTYAAACKNKSFHIGELLITTEKTLLNEKTIINFPTKKDWRKPSEYSYIEQGLIALKEQIITKNIQSIAIPPLGAGNGGLNWQQVKQLLIQHLEHIDCDIYIYEPSNQIKELMNKERVKLTPARAMLLSVLYEFVKNGEFVSEFAAEKSAYFLQRFGAENAFKLIFKPDFYGPYSGKVRHVLYHLNGSYIKGYGSKDTKPFEELDIIMSTETDIDNFLKLPENNQYRDIVKKTKDFLKGFYSPFGLELLSTIDFIRTEQNIHSEEEIGQALNQWSSRKTRFSNPKFIQVSLKNLEHHFDSHP